MNKFVSILFLIVALVFGVCCIAGSLALADEVENQSSYSRMVETLQSRTPDPSPQVTQTSDYPGIFFLDIIASLLCLLVAFLLLAKSKIGAVIRFVWFLVIVNVSWFIAMIFLKGLWFVIYFFAIKAEPALHTQLSNFFTVFVMATAVIIYIWLIARSFSLDFFGALGICLALHMVFFSLMAVFIVVAPDDNNFCALMKANMGPKAMISNYAQDAQDIISNQDLISYFRLRTFRL